jgi:hypothetical protein
MPISNDKKKLKRSHSKETIQAASLNKAPNALAQVDP